MRLLMLDFDEHLVSAVTRALMHDGVDVVAARSLERAREQLLAQQFDAVLMDCDLIRASELSAFTQLPVILTTSFLEPEGNHPFFRRARLLRKPFTSAQLLSALREIGGLLGADGASLLDVLRRAHSQRQSLCLRVGRALVFVERGELVDALLDGARGERALAEVLAESWSVEVLPAPACVESRSIHRQFQELMLDLLRHIEERERREAELAAARRDSGPPAPKGAGS